MKKKINWILAKHVPYMEWEHICFMVIGIQLRHDTLAPSAVRHIHTHTHIHTDTHMQGRAYAQKIAERRFQSDTKLIF